MAYASPIVVSSNPNIGGGIAIDIGWMKFTPTATGEQYLRFGEYLQPISFVQPAAVPLPVQPIAEEVEEESYFKVTPKGRENGILDAPPQPLKRKHRQPAKDVPKAPKL